MREHLVYEFIKILFVKSEENVADIFAKNIRKEVFEKQVKMFLGKKESNH
jgi:hypothetical protein